MRFMRQYKLILCYLAFSETANDSVHVAIINLSFGGEQKKKDTK